MSRISVKYKAGVNPGEIASLEKTHNLKEVKKIPPLRIYGYEVPPEKLGSLKGVLGSSPLVEYVEEDGEMKIL